MVEVFVGVLAALLVRDLLRVWLTDGYSAHGQSRRERWSKRLAPLWSFVGLKDQHVGKRRSGAS